MKLSKLYSNKKEIFEDIKFNNDGINVIFAKVKKPNDKSKDSHNLGKTLLIDLIDFVLLKTVSEDLFLKKNITLFHDFEFYLELKIGEEKYLTIKRAVLNNKNIFLKIHDFENQDFRHEEDNFWDFSLSLKKAKDEANKIIDLQAISPYDYRKGISYFLRKQGDYSDVFQIDKFSGSKHMYWKPYIAKLLGFNEDLINKKYDKDEEIEEKKKFKLQFENTVSIDSEDFDKLQGAIKIKDKEISDKESEINKFNFYAEEMELNSELVNNIEEDISELNTNLYRNNYDVEMIKKAISKKINFNLEEIKKVYDEAEIYFSTKFIKEYSELLEFNKNISEERLKYLNERLKELNELNKNILDELFKLNKKREDILSVIQDKDSFSKFRKLQADLINEKTKLIELKTQLDNLNQSDNIQKKIDKLIDEREKLIVQIRESVKESNLIYESIRENFNSIIKYVFNTPALLSIRPNKEGNLDFNASFIKDEENMIMTSEDKGTTYRKILCAAFDLSVLMAYSEKKFYKFVYHDGILETLDNRKKELYLKKVREISLKYNIQYILSVINHDLPRDENNQLIEFAKKEVVKTLHDDGEDGRLFKMPKF